MVIMRLRTLDRKLLRDLWQLKGQVITIALVVASGIAAFCAALSTYESLKSMQAEYYETARFAHVFVQLKRAPDSVAAELLDIPGVASAETTITRDVLLDLPGVTEPMTGRMIALPRYGEARMNRLTLVAGRWIGAPESNEVLVSETFAENNRLRPGSQVSALLNGKLEKLSIAGIVLSPEYVFPVQPGVGDERTFGVFWMGQKRLAAAFNMDGAFNTAALRLAHDGSARAVVAAVDRILGPYGSIGAFARDEQMSHRTLTQEINQQRVFGLVLPAVFLGVAVFLLNVVLSRQIGTQRGQIAALKALGRPDWEIGLHYLKFVLVIVVIGSLIGVAAGARLGDLLTNLYAESFRFPNFDYRLAPWIPLAGIGISAAGALAGAARAILKVVRLPPAEAMRPASPPTFRQTVAERLGFGHLYSPAVRMILRDMERRPGRSLFTTFGISAALAILISGTWWGDAVNYLLDVELVMRERMHVGVQLGEATSSAAAYDFFKLPGVIAAESSREALVRFRNGHRTYRTALIGLPPVSEMRPLLDAQLQRVPLPAAGVVLNRRLAERLGVAPGGTVRIEFLQGARQERDVPVAGLVEEKMRMAGYMDRTALNHLLQEGDAISAARLLIDTNSRAAFFQAVKQTPRMGGVAELGPIIRNFRETTARNILVFTTVLSVLAGTIAVGVVYNTARIALAERAWELASLRVLGFTRGEVSGLLLGELALELLVALPFGWLFGYGLAWGMLQAMPHEDFEFPFVILPGTYAYATLVVLAAGVISGLIVRRRVDQLDMVAVLKTRE
ncbi:MAG: ABC transporter permease [Burkholderiales bacterium]